MNAYSTLQNDASYNDLQDISAQLMFTKVENEDQNKTALLSSMFLDKISVRDIYGHRCWFN